MKKALIFLSFATFILFTSCEKDAEPEPESITLAQDLQNGYWEVVFGLNGSVWKLNTHTMDSWWLEGNPVCIVNSSTQDYTLEGNLLTIGNDPNPATVEIQGDTLTLTFELDGFEYTFERKLTLDYSGC